MPVLLAMIPIFAALLIYEMPTSTLSLAEMMAATKA
jgi:hypothetical protein